MTRSSTLKGYKLDTTPARHFLIVVALVLMNVATAAVAAEMTLNSNRLLSACTKPDKEWIGFCNGYLQAAFDAAGGSVCPPVGVTRNDVFGAVVPRLKEFDQRLDQDALPVVIALLRQAYPCG